MSESLLKILAYWLLVLLLGVLCISAVMIAFHLPGWLGGVDNLISKTQLIPGDIHNLTLGLTADSKTIATDIHRDVVVAGAASAETEKTMRLIRSEAPSFIQQGHLELSESIKLTHEATLTVQEAQKAIIEISSLPAHLNPLADNLAEAVNTTNTLIADPATAGMRDHISGLAEQGAYFIADARKFENHVDSFFFPPKYSGSHPFWHGVEQVGKKALTFADKAYYLTNIK